MTDHAAPKSAVIIGGGHNGLICAAILARRGVSVDVLEAREALGGGLDLSGSHPPLHPSVRKAAGLKNPKLTPVAAVALCPDGNPITLGESAPEAEAYKAFREEYLAYAKALSPLMLHRPPRLKGFDRADAQTLGRLGWAIRVGLGKAAMSEFLRVFGMNIYDVLQERFSNERLKGAIAFDAVIGNHLGPRTPGTVLTYLLRLFHDSGRMRIPANQTVAALKTAAEQAGVRMRTNTKVAHILVEDDRAVGIALENGEELRADVVVSNADAKTTYLKLLGAKHLDAMFTHRISKSRTAGTVAKLRIALKDMPEITGLGTLQPNTRYILSPDMRSLERAFNASKYGEFSKAPVLEAMLEGDALSITAAYAPHDLKQGWDAGRDAFANAVMTALSPVMPAIKDLAGAISVMTPADIAQAYGSSGGHWHHGDITFDQAFMMRPVHGTSQYAAPIPGLYLCGASTHPGGDISGLPGHNAAMEISRGRGSWP